MNFYSGCTIPREWRAPLAGDEPPPKEPLIVNFFDLPEVIVEVRIKVLKPGERVLSFTLLDDGWDVDETFANGPDTVELVGGQHRYTVFVYWDDDPQLLSYLGIPPCQCGAEAPCQRSGMRSSPRCPPTGRE